MKTKLSYKDFVLIIGIVVAVVIAITTWMYTDHQPKTNIVRPTIKKETLNSTTSIILGKLIKKASTSDYMH